MLETLKKKGFEKIVKMVLNWILNFAINMQDHGKHVICLVLVSVSSSVKEGDWLPIVLLALLLNEKILISHTTEVMS